MLQFRRIGVARWGNSPMAAAPLPGDFRNMRTIVFFLLAVAGVMVLSDALLNAVRKS